MQQFKTGQPAVGTRADIFVASKYPQFARSALKNLFERQEIQINGKVAKPGYKLRYGDRVTVNSEKIQSKPEPIELPVIYEDKNVVVINKPAGILTHSKGALNLEPTVASFVRNKINDHKLTGNRAGIVHRLDRATSGVIICARNQQALTWLQKQFSSRKVKKTYLAITEGILEPTVAIIDVPIGRNPKKPQTFKATAVGRPAQTRYKVRETLSNDGKKFALVELKPATGRTHQIRVHLAYIGFPIVGDYIYGHNGRAMLLHAQKLELKLPNSPSKVFSAPLPESFKDFLKDE